MITSISIARIFLLHKILSVIKPKIFIYSLLVTLLIFFHGKFSSVDSFNFFLHHFQLQTSGRWGLEGHSHTWMLQRGGKKKYSRSSCNNSPLYYNSLICNNTKSNSCVILRLSHTVVLSVVPQVWRVAVGLRWTYSTCGAAEEGGRSSWPPVCALRSDRCWGSRRSRCVSAGRDDLTFNTISRNEEWGTWTVWSETCQRCFLI